MRWRTKSLPRGRYLKVAITRRKGPRGGRTVAHLKRKIPAWHHTLFHLS